MSSSSSSFPLWLVAVPASAGALPSADDKSSSDRTMMQLSIADNSECNSSSTVGACKHTSQSSSDYSLAYHIPVNDMRSSVSSESSREPQSAAIAVALNCEIRRRQQGSARANWLLCSTSEDESGESDGRSSVALEVGAGKLARSGDNSGTVESCHLKFPGWGSAAVPNSHSTMILSSNSNVQSTADGGPEESAPPNREHSNAVKEAQESNESKESSESNASSESSESCCACCSPMRALGLIGYYLVLWAVTIAFTWLMLELLLIGTSRGPFPYYMSAHSYSLASPQIGFSGANPELGKVTEFADLPALLAQLEKQLRRPMEATRHQQSRDCDAPSPPDAAAPSEEELMKPCNVTNFAVKAIVKAKSVLKDRPAFVIEIRRRLGYLPKSGANIAITCTASTDGSGKLPLRYYSWTGSAIGESTDSGSVPTSYFPMLSKHHYAPSVLVAIDTAAQNSWLGKMMTVLCRPADGGPEKPERQVILKIKA